MNPGKPRKHPREAMSVPMPVRISPLQLRAYRTAAKEKNLPLSTWVRLVLDEAARS